MMFSKAEGVGEKDSACQSHTLEWARVPSSPLSLLYLVTTSWPYCIFPRRTFCNAFGGVLVLVSILLLENRALR